MSESRTVPVVIVSADLPSLWLLGAALLLLALAVFLRRNGRARWTLSVGAGLCFVGAWLL